MGVEGSCIVSPVHRLADALPDFGECAAVLIVPSEPGHHAPALPDPEVIVSAVTAAERALAARLSEAHAAELAATEERHAEQLAALEASLGEAASRRIHQAFGEAEGRICELMVETTARMLSHFMADAVKQRSIAAMEEALRRALADDEALRIRISGPRSLYEPLAGALGPRAVQLEFTEAPGFDLQVTIGERMLETRLGEWSSAVEEILS